MPLVKGLVAFSTSFDFFSRDYVIRGVSCISIPGERGWNDHPDSLDLDPEAISSPTVTD